MTRNGPKSSRESSGRRWSPRREADDDPDAREQEPAGRAERVVLGAETGLRWGVQAVALVLWAGVGLVFWLPLLLRRTGSYVVAVLHSGLTGRGMTRARRRWRVAVAFYRVGFQRIVRAFSDEERFPGPAGETEPRGEEDYGSFPFELLWSAAVWTTVLWLTGLWPNAPAAIREVAVGGWESAASLTRQLPGWWEGLF